MDPLFVNCNRPQDAHPRFNGVLPPITVTWTLSQLAVTSPCYGMTVSGVEVGVALSWCGLP